MKHIHKHPVYLFEGRAWLVNAHKSGLRTDILRSLLAQLLIMLDKHRKVFVYRFDLHVDHFTNTNKIISNFNRRLFKRIKSHYGVKRIGYCWVRELEKAKKQHYHYVLILDGSKINLPYNLQRWITQLWEYEGSKVHLVRYHNINRDDDSAINKASRHLSYLAKPRGKGYRPAQTKDYGASRLSNS